MLWRRKSGGYSPLKGLSNQKHFLPLMRPYKTRPGVCGSITATVTSDRETSIGPGAITPGTPALALVTASDYARVHHRSCSQSESTPTDLKRVVLLRSSHTPASELLAIAVMNEHVLRKGTFTHYLVMK